MIMIRVGSSDWTDWNQFYKLKENSKKEPIQVHVIDAQMA